MESGFIAVATAGLGATGVEPDDVGGAPYSLELLGPLLIGQPPIGTPAATTIPWG